ncbi:class I fructose-bisphosphate aldolase [Pedobacter sp. MC2016-24]|uniref:class I fructose-bisphosphate aldolase n=1 Tax=Pedobacter sp. MC2016-24 TaxID=2780090 RepID=UPI00188199AF|nr:aldolase [Pedobacter sp. MC2016-24]MBE9601890.1 aldolase [Pedobacter sp. MC2016-24]
MKQFRLNRLFNPISGRCFDVAVDHGFFNEYVFLQGIENMQKAVNIIIDAAPDAIQLTPGQLKYLQRTPGKTKPALVLRTDVANVYGNELPSTAFSKMIDQPILQAVRADAACICINLFSIPGAPEVTAQCIDNIIKIKTEADHYGMPLMIEPLVFRPNSEKGGYQVDGDLKKILPLVRQAVELGADIIKADPCDDVNKYHRVIEIAGETPVLVRGGGRATDEEILQRTAILIQQGVSGIVYGRNIIQHADPAGITRVLMGMVHEHKSFEESIEMMSMNQG